MIYTVRSPTRVTKKKTISLIDVIVTNKDNHAKLATVDLGYSDHKTQILHLNVNTKRRGHKKVKTRQFT